MNIFITGGTGFVGRHLIHRLTNEGHRVTALVRKNSDVSALNAVHVELVEGDIRDSHSFASKLVGIDVVYHLAGVVTDWAPPTLYQSVHVQGTKNVLDAAKRSKIKLFVHMSTLDVLEKNKLGKNHYVIDDSTHRYSQSKSPYIKTKIQAEKLFISLLSNTTTNFVICRPVWIYGPGDKTLFPEIAYHIKRGDMMFIGNKDNLIQLVYIGNLIEYLVQVMRNKNVWGHAVTLRDRGNITLANLCAYIASSLGLRDVSKTIPYPIAYSFAALSEFWGHMLVIKTRPLLTRTAVEMLGQNVEVRTPQTESLINLSQKVSMAEGMEQTILWLRSSDIEKIRVK